MNASTFRISLDVHRQTTQAHLAVKKGDTARTIIASLSDGGKPYKIEEGCYAVFTGKKPDGGELFNDCRIENDRIVYDFTGQTASAVGRMPCEFRLYGADGNVITSPRIDLIISGVTSDDGDVESTSEYTALAKALADVLTLKAEGLKGDPGDNVELRYQDRLVQWRYATAEGEPEDEWKVLFSSDEVRDQVVQETLDQAQGYADDAAASAKNAAENAEAASDRAQDAYDDSMVSKKYAEQAAIYADQARQAAEDANVPEALPNPQKLILTGAVEAEYDGSGEVKVEIPVGGSKDVHIGSEPPTNGEAIWINPDEEPEGTGGAVSAEAIQQAVDKYLEENPPEVSGGGRMSFKTKISIAESTAGFALDQIDGQPFCFRRMVVVIESICASTTSDSSNTWLNPIVNNKSFQGLRYAVGQNASKVTAFEFEAFADDVDFAKVFCAATSANRDGLFDVWQKTAPMTVQGAGITSIRFTMGDKYTTFENGTVFYIFAEEL